jgi:hypothetical protein
MRGSRPLVVLLLIVAVACLAIAILYLTVKTNFLASGRPIRHTERAVAFAIVGVVCLVGAYFARPKRVV